MILQPIISGGVGIGGGRFESFSKLHQRRIEACPPSHAVDRFEAAGGYEPGNANILQLRMIANEERFESHGISAARGGQQFVVRSRATAPARLFAAIVGIFTQSRAFNLGPARQVG
jgi:hypothetical protein